MDAAEYKHLVLGLIFLKYIANTFQARRGDLRLRLVDPNDEYFYGHAADEDIDGELEDRDYCREAKVFWVPEAARWEAIRSAAVEPPLPLEVRAGVADTQAWALNAPTPRLDVFCPLPPLLFSKAESPMATRLLPD